MSDSIDYKELEDAYASATFGRCEPDIMITTRPWAIIMSLRGGFDVPDVLLPPSGPGFSAQ